MQERLLPSQIFSTFLNEQLSRSSVLLPISDDLKNLISDFTQMSFLLKPISLAYFSPTIVSFIFWNRLKSVCVTCMERPTFLRLTWKPEKPLRGQRPSTWFFRLRRVLPISFETYNTLSEEKSEQTRAVQVDPFFVSHSEPHWLLKTALTRTRRWKGRNFLLNQVEKTV